MIDMQFAVKIDQLFHQKIVIRLLLVLILALALFIRLYGLNELRLTQDEMSIGYNAYAISVSGKDEWGVSWPLAFKAFGDWKLPGYIYATVPFVKLLGLNNYAVKLPSVMAGTLIVLGMFMLVKKLTKNDGLGLVASVITAFSPWSIHLSRMALESNLALAFFLWGIIFLIYSVENKKTFFKLKKKNHWWFWSILLGLSWAMAFYTYVSFRVIVAVMWLAVIVLSFFYKLAKKKIVISLLVFCFMILPIVSLIFGQSGTARFSQVSIFSDQGVAAQINERRAYCYLVDQQILAKICPLVFNKPQVYLENFVKNYLQFLLPTFLFIKGDSLEYLNDPNFGELVWVLVPFYLIGLIYWFRRPDYFSNLIKLGFLIAPVPSTLAGPPQIVRGSALLPFVIIFTVYGFGQLWLTIKNKTVKLYAGLAILGLFCFLTVHYLIHYLFVYPRQYQAYFFPMGPEVGEYLLAEYDNYDTIYISNDFSDVHIFLAYLAKYDPEWYLTNVKLPEVEASGFQHPIRLGKFVFAYKKGQVFLADETVHNLLYVASPTEEIPYTKQFKGFSNVHTQVQVMDVDVARAQMIEQEQLLLPIND